MNKNFKFRAWDNKNKCWLMGYEYPNLGGFSLFGEAILFGEWGKTFDKFLFERDGLTWDDLIVMQSTGLLDKDGTEAYEGDVCEHIRLDGTKLLFKIFRVAGGFAVNTHQDDFSKPAESIAFYDGLSDMQTASWFTGNCKIIGNIHEAQKNLLPGRVGG